MPRPRRMSRVRRGVGRLTGWQAFSLLQYEGLDDVTSAWSYPEHRADAWARHGVELVGHWTQDPENYEWPLCILEPMDQAAPVGPFFRPCGWWDDAARPWRLCLACGKSTPTPGLRWSLAECRCAGDRIQESNAAYLSRLGLLLEHEHPTPADLEPRRCTGEERKALPLRWISSFHWLGDDAIHPTGH